MIKIFKFYTSILSEKDKINVIFLLLIIILSSFIEVIGITSIYPIISIIENKNLVFENHYINKLYNILNYKDIDSFLIFVSIAAFVIIVISYLIKMFILYFQYKLTYGFWYSVSNFFYNLFINQSYSNFKKQSNNILSSDLIFLIHRSTNGVLISLIEILSKIFTVLLIIPILIYIDPIISITILLLGLIFYFIFILSVRSRLFKFGTEITIKKEQSLQIISETFTNFRLIKLFNKYSLFIENFKSINKRILKIEIIQNFFAALPKNLSELVLFIGIFGAIFLVFFYDYSFSKLLIFSIFYLRLLPYLQQIISSYIKFISHLDASIQLNKIKSEIEQSIYQSNKNSFNPRFKNVNKISFKNINFNFNNKKILNNLSFEINKKDVIGIFGPSGVGKTTLVEVISGLLKPNSGEIFFNNDAVDFSNLKELKFSYTPQDTFLLSGDLKRNISMENNTDYVDSEKLNKVIKMVNLSEFNNILIDQDGKNLSGGQKQRIGIARSLYNDHEILILDESTSNIDVKLVKKILKKILDNINFAIIIISHDLEIKKVCNKSIMLNKND